MQVAADTIVAIEYTLTNSKGEVLDSSVGREPLAYLHGHGNIIPGLENALLGKSVNDALKVTLTPKEGYGERDLELVRKMHRSNFEGEGVPALQPGMRFRASSPKGQHVVVITHIDGDDVTVDGNHPLAGVALTFDVKVVEIKPASREEIEHGHVHGPGGHHHH